ncbi:MAG: glycosyltransferase family 1 protein [Desulfobacteraceae bacterium]|nr:MAG: glycosyltransferase family 1 protein [Desulfobacteraceae bacterium]
MRVLQLIKTTSGAAWALKQVRELVTLDVDVHVALPAYSGNASLFELAGATVHVLNSDLLIKTPWKSSIQFKSLRQLVDGVKPDLIHSHFFGTTMVMRLALKRIQVPKVFQVPGPLHLEHRFFRETDILTATDQDHWIASCQWTRDTYNTLLKQRYTPSRGRQRVFLSYYGTDLDHFVRHDRSYLRDMLGIPEQACIVGMVAYMYPPKYYLGQTRGLKGHEDLIDALSMVRKTHGNVHLVFVGGAWGGADQYEHRISAYGKQILGEHVTFMGTRKDVAQLYSGFDLAVHPSYSENVGGAVESLLMGIPTITTDVGGFPDLIRHNQTGLLAEPRNPVDLAEKIVAYLDDPDMASAHCQRGTELTRYLFDVKRTAKEIKLIYQTILAQSVK